MRLFWWLYTRGYDRLLALAAFMAVVYATPRGNGCGTWAMIGVASLLFVYAGRSE